jgi:hypothetical protein
MATKATHAPCPVCNSSIIKRDDEKPYRWRTRVCCQKRCTDRYVALRTAMRLNGIEGNAQYLD